MAQNNAPPPRAYLGAIPAGYMIPNTINLPYPLPPQIPVGLQPAPSGFYPVSVQMSTQPQATPPASGALRIHSGPQLPAQVTNVPTPGQNLVFRPQTQPPQNPAPGSVIQYVPGGYPDADAVARAQAQAAAQASQAAQAAAQAAQAASGHATGGIQYFFGDTPVNGRPLTAPQQPAYGYFVPQVRAPEPYAYGIIAPPQPPAPRPVSPTDYGSGDPQGRRFHYVRI